MVMPTIQRLDTGYWHVRWNDEVWAQWSIEYDAPRVEDFFHETGDAERISEAAAAVRSWYWSKGIDPLSRYTAALIADAAEAVETIDADELEAYAAEKRAEDDRDEAYERAAARARANDFKDTGGKDWT